MTAVPPALPTASVWTLPTPAGPLCVVEALEDNGPLVLAAWFGADVPAWAPAGRAGLVRAAPRGPAADAVTAWAAGEVDTLDAVPVRQPGGPFLQRAWEAMREIPAGDTRTYAEIAAKAGSPGAVRAAGQACARNRVAPFVPCHRVVRSDGTLGGYAYGVSVKARLLAHERAAVAARSAAR